MAADFGRLLRQARDEAGLTQEELAGLTGLSVSSIQNYETRHAVPRRKSLAKLAQATNKPLLWFRDGVPERRVGAPAARESSADLFQQVLAAKDREICDMREVALATHEDFEKLRCLVETELVPFFVRGSEERYAEIIRNSYQWLVDILERQLESLSQRSAREAAHFDRPTKDFRPVDYDDSQRGYARRRRRGQAKNHLWPAREPKETESDDAAEST